METRGFLKCLVERDSDRILGFAALGVGADEILGCVQIAMLGGISYTAPLGSPSPSDDSRGVDSSVFRWRILTGRYGIIDKVLQSSISQKSEMKRVSHNDALPANSLSMQSRIYSVWKKGLN